MKPAAWQTLQIAIIVSPFWFLASTITDGDEAFKTMIAVGMSAAVSLIGKKFGHGE